MPDVLENEEICRCKKCGGVADKTYDLCDHCATPLHNLPTPNNVVEIARAGDGNIIFNEIDPTVSIKVDVMVQLLFRIAIAGMYDQMISMLTELPLQQRVQCLQAKRCGRTIVHELLARCSCPKTMEQFMKVLEGYTDQVLAMLDDDGNTPAQYKRAKRMSSLRPKLLIFCDQNHREVAVIFANTCADIGIQPCMLMVSSREDISSKLLTPCDEDFSALIIALFTGYDILPRKAIMVLLRGLNHDVEKVLIASTSHRSTDQVTGFLGMIDDKDASLLVVEERHSDRREAERFVKELSGCLISSSPDDEFATIVRSLQRPDLSVQFEDRMSSFHFKQDQP